MNTDTAIREASKRLLADLDGIESTVLNEDGSKRYTLADAIREGSTVSGQAYDWSDSQGNLCALSAATAAIEARGL